MVVSRFKVPGKVPMPFLKNLRERAKVLVLKLKSNETEINVPKIDHQAKLLAFRNRQRVNAKRKLTMLHDTAIVQKLRKCMKNKVGMPKNDEYCLKNTGLDN